MQSLNSSSQLSELIQFLNCSRIELKSVALQHILGLTSESVVLLSSNADLLRALVQLTEDECFVIAKDACFTLINISTNETSSEALLKSSPSNQESTGLLQIIVKNILNVNSKLADMQLSILSNLSRSEKLVDSIAHELLEIDSSIFDKFVAAFSKSDYNQQQQSLNYLAAVFSNLSQSSTFRNLVANKSQSRLLQRLLPFINHDSSLIRRGGITGLLKNICFDSSLHEWLLSSDVDILPYILLPLAGPEEFDEETNEHLPLELQYLEPDKKHEPDVDIRTILLESLAQLCATRNGRNYLRDKSAYEILRELHKFEVSDEGDLKSLRACENVVDILIRTEDEIGHDNLKHVEISDELREKIEKMED